MHAGASRASHLAVRQISTSRQDAGSPHGGTEVPPCGLPSGPPEPTPREVPTHTSPDEDHRTDHQKNGVKFTATLWSD